MTSRYGVTGCSRIAARLARWNACSSVTQLRPRLGQPDAELLAEGRRVVGAAAVAARRPGDHLLGRVVPRQPGHEARAVQIRVRLELEVDFRAFRDQAQRVVERRVVFHHRAEDHLVVAALRASEAAGHPGIDEDRNPFVKPSRRGHAWRGQVEIEDRLGLLGDRQHFSAEQTPEDPIAPRRLVHRRDVDQLVVHQRVHALVGRNRLEDVGDGGDLDGDEIVGHRGCAGIALVGQVDEQDRHLVVRIESEQLLLKTERVERRPRRVRHEERFAAIDVEEAQAGRALLGELRRSPRRTERDERSDKKKSGDQPGRAHQRPRWPNPNTSPLKNGGARTFSLA